MLVKIKTECPPFPYYCKAIEIWSVGRTAQDPKKAIFAAVRKAVERREVAIREHIFSVFDFRLVSDASPEGGEPLAVPPQLSSPGLIRSKSPEQLDDLSRIADVSFPHHFGGVLISRATKRPLLSREIGGQRTRKRLEELIFCFSAIRFFF